MCVCVCVCVSFLTCTVHIFKMTRIPPYTQLLYIVKLGYRPTQENIFFLFLLQDIDCGYSLEPSRRGGSIVYSRSMF